MNAKRNRLFGRMNYLLVLIAMSLAIVACRGAEPSAPATNTAPAPDASPTTTAIKLNAISMLTGSSGFYGQATSKGNELAVDELNERGGILGQEIEYVVQDNASEDVQTVNLVRKIGSQDPVPAFFIAPTFQPNMEAACGVATQLGIVQIATNSAPPPSSVNSEGFCFVNSADTSRLVEDTISFMNQNYGHTEFVQIYDQQNAWQSNFDKLGTEFINNQGWSIPVDSGVDTGTTDYGPVITQISEANPEVVVVNLTTEDAARFMQQARARGVEAIFVNATQSLIDDRLYELSGGAAEGLIVSTVRSAEADPRFKEFVDAFVAKYGELDDPIAGGGYDLVMLLAEGIERAGTSTNPEEIRDALFSIDEFCASICFDQVEDGNFNPRDLYFLELTEDGFVSLD